MKHFLLYLSLIPLVACSPPVATRHNSPAPNESLERAETSARVRPNSTFCNPIDINYRFMVDTPSRREAADPLITLYKGEYYLFASKSGGYWHSSNLRDWSLIVPKGLPLEDYAPATLILDGRMYYTAHRSKALYTSDDPAIGKWRKVADMDRYDDPAFFRDDDGRVYLSYGSSLNGSISSVELDPRQNFRVIGGPFKLMTADYADHGWERSGPENLGAEHMIEGYRIGPYIEGSWMTKHDGTYYLQYSAPGTIWKTYADGVYTSRFPTSGFSYAPYSPFSYKPGGFVGGAGHAATFLDKAGNYWRVVTMIISVKHKFERRLGIFPAGFDNEGVMRTDTYLGDYPQFVPGVVASPLDHNRTGWMLVSRGKPAIASSILSGHDTQLALDEDIRTWWSARSGDAGEWLRVDLGAPSRINAVQVNFAEQDTRAFGRSEPIYQRYLVEASIDGEHWSMVLDRSSNARDVPHDYVQLDQPTTVRFVRITNLRAAPGGKFAIRDLRVFGKGSADPPPAVMAFAVHRHSDDRSATIDWERAPRASAYIVRFGITPDKLYSNYQVGDVTTLTLNSLNRGVAYFFTVDALNESGVVKSGIVKPR